MHPLNHKFLQYGAPIVVLTGALAGLLAPFVIKAFGILQINPGIGSKALHEFAEEVHEIAFDALVILILVHAGFHLWRHFWLKDNALRIMVPEPLHKYL
ncbi:MAG: cytochrome b/b6 domain-containing protein [Paracoccaceae bacterium]